VPCWIRIAIPVTTASAISATPHLADWLPPPPHRRAAETPPGWDRVPPSPALQKLIHPNIVKLKDVTMENHEPFFIFENMVCKPRPVHDASHTKTNEPRSNPSSSWSDLPKDLVLSILQRLQLPEAIAFASVCTSWLSAATAAGVPRSCTPMIMSWRDILESRESRGAKGSSSVNCKFLHLLDVHKAYDVRFPQGLCFMACCGSSHGWLILVNELANLVLYNPFTSEMIPLPPITDFTCVEAVCGSKGNIEAYNFENHRVQDAKYLATWFYQKAVLSCSPSKSANYVVMIIHRDNNWLSSVRAGDSNWQVAATLVAQKADRYADCAYHNGMFYTVTFEGIVEKWDVDGPNGPAKEVIVAKRSSRRILSRHLVSTPWGDLLEVRAFVANSRRMYRDGVAFRIFKVHLDGYEKVSPVPKIDLMEHAILIGLNHSACLSTKNFPWLRPCCIYFSVPWMTPICHLLRRCPEWGGVRTYDIKQRTFDHVFRLCPHTNRLNLAPSEVWITPNL